MRAAELIALAAAHGIDLPAVAGNASDIHGVARKRRLTGDEVRFRRENKLSMHIEDTARGAGSRVYRRPAWTSAELGQAAQGVPRMPWLAACFSYAGDSSGAKELHRGLMYEALRLADRDDWPLCVRGRDGWARYYIAELAALVLDVETHKHYFVAAPTLYAVYIGVEENVWNASLASRYSDLSQKYDRWLSISRSMIQEWLKPEEQTEVATVVGQTDPLP